ncbi:YceI family protein [Actinomadura sp. B10D3]|uniref:YceI family protein n=1 Tax=Actinomadura sp. B10D3 TaxID=3153557 RepID=UPI00325C5AA3
MTTATTQIPGYIPGTWQIDPIHSDATFSVRHLVSKVRGRFRTLEGEIHGAANVLDSSVRVTIAADSIDTNNQMRDDHLRSADFLETGTYPTLTFASTRIRPKGDAFLVDGDLTIKDVTRQITADVEIGGFTPGHDGVPRAGLTATFEIDRNDYNVNFSKVLETGGVMVGDRVSIQLGILAVLQDE